jgi:hypothetical protein
MFILTEGNDVDVEHTLKRTWEAAVGGRERGVWLYRSVNKLFDFVINSKVEKGQDYTLFGEKDKLIKGNVNALLSGLDLTFHFQRKK